jgi:hypothetical protein
MKAKLNLFAAIFCGLVAIPSLLATLWLNFLLLLACGAVNLLIFMEANNGTHA